MFTKIKHLCISIVFVAFFMIKSTTAPETSPSSSTSLISPAVPVTTRPPTVNPTGPGSTGAPFVDCTEPNHHKQFCATDSICAWNKCNCPRDNACRLVCTSRMGQWCNGLNEEEPCVYNHYVPWRCTALKGKKSKKLMCLSNPALLLFTVNGGIMLPIK